MNDQQESPGTADSVFGVSVRNIRKRDLVGGGSVGGGDADDYDDDDDDGDDDDDDNDDGDFWTRMLKECASPTQDDSIRQCENVDFTDLTGKVDKYHVLADQKLHVFPFGEVHACWHRLYTDTSIIKALLKIQQHEEEQEEHHVGKDLSWADEVIRVLDMSLIMTGGYKREQMIAKIYTKLSRILHPAADDSGHRSHKRRRLTDDFLLQECSVPRLRHDVSKRLHKPSLTMFEAHARKTPGPTLLTGILDHWPALEKWRSRGFWNRISLGGRRLVPVEIGRSYVDDGWSQQIVTFQTFLDQYVAAADEDVDNKGYLAQYDLFRHFADLQKDMATPDYCFLDLPPPAVETPVTKAKMKAGLTINDSDDVEVQKNIWFGPPWTISPLHHDPYHNVLCQVMGKKYIRLYSPQHSANLYPRSEKEAAPHGKGTIDMSNTSTVDVAAMELSPDEDWDEKWPGIGAVPYQEIILEAGQALYIPVGWWHYVRSCSIGISVSFWWL